MACKLFNNFNQSWTAEIVRKFIILHDNQIEAESDAEEKTCHRSYRDYACFPCDWAVTVTTPHTFKKTTIVRLESYELALCCSSLHLTQNININFGWYLGWYTPTKSMWLKLKLISNIQFQFNLQLMAYRKEFGSVKYLLVNKYINPAHHV